MSQTLKVFLEQKVAALKQEQTLLGAHLSLNEKSLELLYECLDKIAKEQPVPQSKLQVVIQPGTLTEAILTVLRSKQQWMTARAIKAAIPDTGFTGKIAGNKVSAKLWELSAAKKIAKNDRTKPLAYFTK